MTYKMNWNNEPLSRYDCNDLYAGGFDTADNVTLARRWAVEIGE